MEKLDVFNPYTGKKIDSVSFDSSTGISKKIERSHRIFQKWKTSPAWRRAELLESVATAVQEKAEEFANLITLESGKPITFSKAEVDRAIFVLRWAAGEALRFSGEVLRQDVTSFQDNPGMGFHFRFPRGIILGITPFNFPLNLLIHKVAPAIASGCAILVKPSPFTPLTCRKIISIIQELEPDLVNEVITDDKSTAKLTVNDAIAMVSFTGSAAVGRIIQRQIPEKPIVLELGGNAWCLVLADVKRDALPEIAKKLVMGAFGYSGQTCISVQNVAIAESHWKEMRELLVQETLKVAYGDPLNSEVVAGPLIHQRAVKRVQDLIADSGGKITESKNAVNANETTLPPTLVELEHENHEIVQEEAFGPLFTVRSYSNLKAITKEISAGRYGLQTGVFTHSIDDAFKLFRELEVGSVMINQVPTTRYDQQPYGGVKESGVGREGIRYAMEEMTLSRYLSLLLSKQEAK